MDGNKIQQVIEDLMAISFCDEQVSMESAFDVRNTCEDAVAVINFLLSALEEAQSTDHILDDDLDLENEGDLWDDDWGDEDD